MVDGKRTWIERSRPSTGWTDNPDFHCLHVDLPGFEKDDIKFNVNESGVIVVSGRKRIGEEKEVQIEKTFKVPENGDVKSLIMTFEGNTLEVVIPKVDKEKKDTPENMDGAASTANAKEEKEKVALPSSNNEEKKKTLERLASSSENRQESKSPPSNDNRENREEEAKKPDSESEDKEKEFQSSKEQGSREKASEYQEVPQKTVIVKIIENKGIFLASIISFTLGVLLSQKFHTSSPK